MLYGFLTIFIEKKVCSRIFQYYDPSRYTVTIKKGGTVGILRQKLIENVALNLNLYLKCKVFHLPAFIQGLIGSNCHPYLITYSKVTIKTQLEKIIKNALMNNLLLCLIIMILIIKLITG